MDVQYIQLIEALPVPILVIDRQKYIQAANALARELLGDHIVDNHYNFALRQPTLLEAIENADRTGLSQSAQYQGQEGLLDTVYLVSIDKVDDAIVVSFQDRTAQLEVSQMRRGFVANVSHELRTPLTALSGFIETLRGPARDDPAARDRFLEIMDREAQRMTRLVDDLLSLSRVEADERVRPVEKTPIGPLVQNALSEMQPIFDKAGVTVSLHDDSDGVAIPADGGQLHQILTNLVENAVKYGEPHGVISVTISKPKDQPKLRQRGIELGVHNSGAVIPAHHIPRLTERFYRVDGHRSREVGGTGLGLAIVKHMVNRHRGVLRIESNEGHGTTATVILPTES